VKPRISQLAQSGAADGEVITWDDTAGEWAPAAASTAVTLHASRTFNTASTGSGILTLGATPYEESLQVFVDGHLKRYGTDYTVSGNVVTFASAVSAGAVVADHYLTTTASPSDSVLTTLPVNITDAFNRADNASSLGTTDTGQTWSAAAGTWGIASNKARCFTAGNQSFAVVESGASDCTIAVTVSGTLNAGGGITFRHQDVNNTWFVDSDSGGPGLWKVISGSYTQVVANLGGTSLVAGDVLSVVLSGSSVIVKRNGTTLYSGTQTQLQTATKHGLRDYGAGIRLDDFSITN
jgi:hypothetical protein